MAPVSPSQILTDVDIMCTEYPAPQFVVPGLFLGAYPLAGKPKSGSRSYHWASGFSGSGNTILGTPVDQGEVLYLALEEPHPD